MTGKIAGTAELIVSNRRIWDSGTHHSLQNEHHSLRSVQIRSGNHLCYSPLFHDLDHSAQKSSQQKYYNILQYWHNLKISKLFISIYRKYKMLIIQYWKIRTNHSTAHSEQIDRYSKTFFLLRPIFPSTRSL